MNTINQLEDVFGVKVKNPVMDFFFCAKEVMDNGEAELPENFGEYRKIDEKPFEGEMWVCYGRKAMTGCFSEKYWRK